MLPQQYTLYKDANAIGESKPRSKSILVPKLKKMMLSKQKCSLPVKLFNWKGCAATEVLRKGRSLKQLRKSPLTSQGLWNMVMKFEVKELLVAETKRRWTCVAGHIVDDLQYCSRKKLEDTCYMRMVYTTVWRTWICQFYLRNKRYAEFL